MNQTVEVVLRGNHFGLLSERCVYWQEQQVLFCSDVHWGRESFLQRMGFAVPDTQFDQESKVLLELMERLQPKEFWVLGDWVHHPKGLDDGLKERFKAWAQSAKEILGRPVALIPGNHDRAAQKWASEIGIELKEDPLVRGEFAFSHAPPETSVRSDGSSQQPFYWFGHLHPAVRMPGLLGKGKVPCFWIRPEVAYLPAFSGLAAGADMGRISAADRVVVCAPEGLIDLNVFS